MSVISGSANSMPTLNGREAVIVFFFVFCGITEVSNANL
jgi:hypothetical protein